MRVLVCGGRDYQDREHVFATLDAIHAKTPVSCIIQGRAPGGDALAGSWAVSRLISCHVFAAEWQKHGRAAGPIRNKRMLEEGRPDLIVAFPGGTGTADMVRQARRAGVRVVAVEPR